MTFSLPPDLGPQRKPLLPIARSEKNSESIKKITAPIESHRSRSSCNRPGSKANYLSNTFF
jgi:hypothetical protein